MPRLIRLVAAIALVSIGLGIGAKLISMGFFVAAEIAGDKTRIAEYYSNQLGYGVAIISAVIFTIRPTLLGPLYKKKPDD